MDIIKLIFLCIYYTLEVVILFYVLYYVITGIFAFLGRKKIYKYRPKNKFAIIIPARNEELVIGTLIESLKKQHYPNKLFDIYVAPNNCTDDTRGAALKSGAKIIDIKVEAKSKGDVLKYCFLYLEEKYNYDAYCIFDADNIVHPNFLRSMNNALCSKYNVAQGYRDTKNPKDTWISSCYALFYYVQNFFFNQSRMNLGWSSSINGTGFMISSEAIKKYGFKTQTMTEDIEFSALCAMNNERIAFVKEAITYDEQPLGFKTSWKQRTRWSFGTMQCLKLYFGKLIKTFVHKKIPQCFDMALFFFAPIFQLLSFLALILTLIVYQLDISSSIIIQSLCENKFLSVIIGYFLSIILSFIVVIFDRKKVINIAKGILTLSIFMITWIPINIICIVKKQFVWEPINHTRNIDINNII